MNFLTIPTAATMSASDQAGRAAQKKAETMTAPDYGLRNDGTPKGRGFLGELRTPDGQVMTEYSIGVDFGEGEQEIPTLVPGLTEQQIASIMRGQVTEDIIQAAVTHARKRLDQGLSPFAMRGVDY